MDEPDAGDFRGNERFKILGRLGAGGHGVVYRAVDKDRHTPVALKTLRHVAAKALVRFKQEFRALADVSHRNLVTLYELSSHDEQWFFTMELVDGVNFLWYVCGDTNPDSPGTTSAVSLPTDPHLIDSFRAIPERTGRLPPAGALKLDRLRHALVQLADGVLALHREGKLHRDIKPSNVLVDRRGRVVLLDFGLVAELAPEHTHTTLDAEGTPAYMSPEQWAGLPLTEASDWYNVGSMLYQALTGHLPFSGPILEVMRRKQECEPVAPHELAPGVPADLDSLCQDLLRLDPLKRPRGAEVLNRLIGVTVAPPAPPEHPSAPFVGREPHLEMLRSAFRSMKGGRAVIVAVHGGSGMGKTALVRRFLQELRAEDSSAVVLSGRCYERESVPYKALDSIIDALSRHLRRLPDPQAEALLPHDILALARLFPVLRQVDAVNRAQRTVLEIPDSQELRRRAFAALRELLVRLADRRPLVLFIDDLQWGDVDSGALLEALLRPPDSPILLLIGCYRSEEADTSPFLKLVLPMREDVGLSVEIREIVVGELAFTEARDLALALLNNGGPVMGARGEAIARESGGNPYFIEELARFSQAEAEPALNRLRWPPAGAAPELTFDEVIQTRVARLAEGERRLLDISAVAGVPIELGAAYRAADVEGEGESVLAALRAAHLVRTRGTPGRQEIETYHDRIRDSVVRQLSEGSLKEAHRRLASALLGTGRADPETLIVHYLGAGDEESAAEFAAAAAAKASLALAFDRAASLYRSALNLRGDDHPDRAELLVKLGDSLANAGRGADAARAYLSATRGATSAQTVDLHRRAAQQYLVSGHVEDGLQVLDTVLAALGMPLPATHRRALLSLLYRRTLIMLRGFRFRERDETQVSPEGLLRIDTCWSVTVGLCQLDMLRGAEFQARDLLLSLRAGEPYRVARAMALEAAFVAMGGSRNRPRTDQLLQASSRLAARVNHPHTTGLLTLMEGVAAWLDGRWKKALEFCERGEAVLRERCTGVVWEILTAQMFQLGALFFLGDIKALLRRLPLLLKEAEERGDLLRTTFLRIGYGSHIAWLAADDPAQARAQLDSGLGGWRQGGFDYLQMWVRMARTDISLYAGDGQPVREPVGARWRAFARALDRFVQTGFVWGLDARARSRLAAAALSKSQEARDSLLRRAEDHAHAIRGEKTLWGDSLAWLVQAGAAATRGETEPALRLLDLSEAGLAAADMALHATAARRRRGQLIGGDGGRSLVAAADTWMAEQGIKNPKRMTEMLTPGRWSAD